MTSVLYASSNTACQVVRLVPDISAACLKQHKDREVGVWYCLRALDGQGRGIIPKNEAIDGLVKVFGYGQRSAYNSIRRAANAGFIRIDAVYLAITSLKKLWQGLNIVLAWDRHFRDIPVEDFDDACKRKAQIYASIHSPGDIHSNPISRAAIKQYCGLSKPTQIKLEREAKVKKVPNYAMLRAGDVIQPEMTTLVSKNKSYRVPKRLPNSYRTQQRPSSKGMLGKIRGGEASLIVREALTPMKRYFTGVRKLTKALEARYHKQDGYFGGEGYYKMPAPLRRVYGRQEWCLMGVMI